MPKPPISVTGIAPDSLRRGESKTFQVEGSNLNGAAVTTTAVRLTISNVQSTATQRSFTLTASSVATLGTQTLAITNTPVASGSAVAQVSVINALPTVYTAPAPVATPPDATSRQIAVRLSNADIYDHSFAASVADPTVATVTPAAFTIVAGQVEAKLTISGLKLGQTSITLTSATLGTAVAQGARRGRGGLPMGVWAWRLSPLLAAVALAVGVWTAATIPEPVAGTGTEIATAWEAADMADFLGGDG